MEQEDFQYGPFNFSARQEFFEKMENRRKNPEAYDFLKEYAEVHNLYTASTAQPNPFSNKAMYIISQLTKMGVKFSVDIFTANGADITWGLGDNAEHKLVNIIAEPNPQETGTNTLFVAHHDVANIHSQNCQDNGASVCNLLRLTHLIHKNPADSKKTLILFSDCEEYGAKGAHRFASHAEKDWKNPIVTHKTYGQIESVVNLELTGKGTVVWSDCESKAPENQLHTFLEKTLGRIIPKLKTPPNDAIAFRKHGYTSLCIGTLPEDDLKDKTTWRLCHSIRDVIEGCDRKNMEDFTSFLLNLTKKPTTTNHGELNPANETKGTM